MALWANELGAFDLKYISWTTMKSQVIVDFIAQFSIEVFWYEWNLFDNKSFNARLSGAGILLKSLNGKLVEHSLPFGIQETNNEASMKH